MPTMAPIDPQATVVPAGGPMPGTNTIPLSTLIDYIIQRTYHELTVLSELLPRKTDMERKIEIVQFASRTRQLFVRLLALVKWASSASKVDKCAVISSFLDQQSMLFVDTADMLSKTARETLVNARLPSFSLPCAIDVLTKGTYTRLPACIREKIIPPDPITREEKRQTLFRLNQIIEHRLVTGDLPSHLRKPKIENGRVRFRVEHEFEVTLTLMGDGNIPWRLLDIEILVEDPETGDGKSLVHSMQIGYIHQLVQSRLMENDRPLHDLYNCLHSFCQSLQLEVLHSQTQRLIQHRLGDCIRIEEYRAGKSLTLSYWRDPSRREERPLSTVYKLSIHVDEHDSNKPLQISHCPQIQGSESTKVAQAIRSDHLSVEKLLMHTIQVRSLSKLRDLEREFRVIIPGPCDICDVPTILYVPILYPCMMMEKLCVAIDIMKGSYLVSLCKKTFSLTQDVEDCINAGKRDLRKKLSKIRTWLGLQRCRKSIQHINISCTDHLPFVDLEGHPLELLGFNKLFVKMVRQPHYYVVVEAFEAKHKTVDFNYYLLQVTPSGIDYDPGKQLGSSSDQQQQNLPKVFLKAGNLVKLETFAITHGPAARLYDVVEEETNPLIRKRKLLMGDPYELPRKRPRGSPYFLPELLHVISHCEERIPFVALGLELQRHHLAHQGIEIDGDGMGMSLTLLDLLPARKIKLETLESLKNDMLSVKFKIQQRTGVCRVEALFTNCPLKTVNPREQGEVHRVQFLHDMSGPDMMRRVLQSLLEEWNCLVHLYEVVKEFSEIYSSSSSLQSNIEIRSYTYKRLTLAYGPNHCYTVSIQYQSRDNQFHLMCGTCGQTTVANCHTVVSTHLRQMLNNDRSLAHLAQVLVDTWSPMMSIGKLTTSPVLGLTSKLKDPCTHFMVMPQSPTHLRIVFRNVYCIDLQCCSNGLVAVRDGAYSMFETSKVVEALTTIAGLKAFLNMYVDETTLSSIARRRSATEDDHPPSPEGVDPLDFMSHAHSSTSPAMRGGPARSSSQMDGLRFHGPMTPPSNPQTPASPSTRLTQAYVASPAANFPLASPPSLQHVVTPSPSTVMAPSPGNPTLHVPSPSSFVPAPSPSSLGIAMPSPANQFLNPQVQTSVAPIINPPSRQLPQRTWAASIPTLLSHEALDKLFTQAILPGSLAKPESNNTILYCPLERFLCCAFLRRHVPRVVAAEQEHLQSITCSEPGVVMFKSETLQFKVSLNSTTLQSIHLKITPTLEFSSQYDTEELQLLEKFFDFKVSVPPYKSHTLTALIRLLALPLRVLKDCIKIMRLELVPDPNLKWSLHWCLTIPQGAPPLAPVGTTAVVYKNKFLFMVQLVTNNPSPTSGEPSSVIVPIVYDFATNKTQPPQAALLTPDPLQNQGLQAVTNCFKRFMDFKPQHNECSLFPAVREVLNTLAIPMM